MDPSNTEDLYRIGTVASLTGISVERLRAWERRYDLSPAHKTGKTRFYSKPQLERLKLIKHLIDQGQPISSLAALDYDQLMGRVENQHQTTTLSATHKPRVGLIGPNLLALEQQAVLGQVQQRLEVVSRWANIEAYTSEQSVSDAPQIIVLQIPVPKPELIEIVNDFHPNADVVVIYQFATAEQISSLQARGLPTLKWPVAWAEVEHIAISELGYSGRKTAQAPRRYSDEELIAIAASEDDPTNCPQYLIESIHQLNGFNVYTADILTTSQHPQRYQSLIADISHARALLEESLERLLDSKST